MNKTRFESFSDSVFAFALTLLVLGFALPELRLPIADAELTGALLNLWPNLIAYALSFAVIGIMWHNHQALFRTVARIDRSTVLLNLFLLGSTVFIPFATATLGRYPLTHAATFLYGIVMTLCSTFFNVILVHLVRSHAFHESLTSDRIAGSVRSYRVGWVTYVVAMLSALLSPILSFALYILITVYYWAPFGASHGTIDDDIN